MATTTTTLNVGEAARRIGISPSKVYQLASARRISHYRIGGKIVFTEADVLAFLDACHVVVTTGAAGGMPAVPPPPRAAFNLRHVALGPGGTRGPGSGGRSASPALMGRNGPRAQRP